MAILSAKNELEENFLSLKPLPGWNTSHRLSNSDIDEILGFSNHWNLANKLIMELSPASDETEIPRFAPKSLVFGLSSLKTYWREREFSGGFDFANFEEKTSIISFPVEQDFKFETKVEENAFANLKRQLGSDNQTGIAILTVGYIDLNGDSHLLYYGIKVSTAPPFVLVIPTPQPQQAPATDNEYTTPTITFESLFIPTLSSSHVYNFYELEEGNFEAVSRRDYLGRALSEIPKYVKLSWNQAPFSLAKSGLNQESTGSSHSEIDPLLGPLAEEGGVITRDGFTFTPMSSEEESAIITTGDGRSAADAKTIFDTGATGVFSFGDSTTDLHFSNFIRTGYAGFVVQKERYDENSQTYIPIDLIVITSPTTTTYIDWKVAYGEIYRYKIRSIFRFLNVDELPMYKDGDQLFDINQRSASFERLPKLFETYYFDGKFSEPSEIEVVEFENPNPPSNVKIFPNSVNREILVTWSQKNSNKDIVGFNVYRKTSSDNRFIKLNSQLLDVRQTSFLDGMLQFDIDYLYAIEAVDIHDNFSNLSAQYQARVVPQNLEVGRCERPVSLKKLPGERIFERPPESVEKTREDNILFLNKRFNLVINPAYKLRETDEAFVIKVKSIDTAQEKEIKLFFDESTIYHADGY